MTIKGIILAGGKGSRFSKKEKKQFYLLDKTPLIIRSAVLFENNDSISEVVIVCCEEDIKKVGLLISEYCLKKVKLIVKGGANSIESAKNGLIALDTIGGCDKVVFHESVRPFVKQQELNLLIEENLNYDCSCLASECYESILVKNTNCYGVEQINRDNIVKVQMPQMYDFDIAKQIVQKMTENNNILPSINLGATFYGFKMYFSICSKWNIKITTQEDYSLAKKLVKLMSK